MAKQPALAILGKEANLTFQKNHPGQRGKLICVTFKPSPSLRVFDVAGGWFGWVE
jgi:hypothetical protein